MQRVMVTSVLLKACCKKECPLIVLMGMIKRHSFVQQNTTKLTSFDCITNYEGDTPVHFAALNNSTEVIAMLIKHGASINITNDRGDKPINQARRYGKKTAVRMLEQL